MSGVRLQLADSGDRSEESTSQSRDALTAMKALSGSGVVA
jgi:hypothetical protein